MNVKKLKIGLKHSAVVTEQGQLYMFGSGLYGVLGNGNENYVNQGPQSASNIVICESESGLGIEETIEKEEMPSKGLENFGVEADAPDLFNSSDENTYYDELLSKNDDGDEEDDLEIPAFLRRQKN